MAAMGQCEMHRRFGDCTCGFNHNEDFCIRNFFPAIILSEIPRKAGTITVATCWRPGYWRQYNNYYLPSESWCRAAAKKNDMVIFQESEEWERYPFLKFGRVLTVLPNRYKYTEDIRIECLNTESFTIDPSKARIRDDAITVESCSKHTGQCKKIGMHVVAAALAERDRVFNWLIPAYSQPFKKKEPGGTAVHSFDCGRIRVSLSVYVHSRSDEVTDPVITVLRVGKNYNFHQKSDEEFKKRFDMLWSHFVANIVEEKVINSLSSRYLAKDPKSWKQLFLLEQMMQKYNEVANDYIRNSSSKINIITRDPFKPIQHESTPKILAFKDSLVHAASAAGEKNVPRHEILFLISLSDEFQTPLGYDEYFFQQRFQADVENSADIRQGSIAKFTSPLRKFRHFLNQQILIRFLINSTEPLYSREDLLGLLVIRFKTPTLAKAYVKGLSKNNVVFDYIQEEYVDSKLSRLDFSVFQNHVEVDFQEETAKIRFRDIYCETDDLYCNRTIVYIDDKVYNDLKTQILHQSTRNLGEVFSQLQKTKSEDINPYAATFGCDGKRNGTILTLQRGIELQMQISKYERERDVSSLGLRILRIGKNCHYCFMHVNNVEKAFMTDRNDVRKLITEDRMSMLKKATTEELLDSSKLIKVHLEWTGAYFQGGSFTADVAVKKGDLLCIRKEVFNKEGIYVWNCHGIVESVDGNSVTFVLCTLSQMEGISKGNFCVEIIDVKAIESNISVRQSYSAKRRNTM